MCLVFLSSIYVTMETFEDNFDDPVQEFNDSDLVDAVVVYPALYDVKLAHYHNTSIKSRCWELVSQKVNHPVDLCMSRWIRLKDNFRREKNKRDLESRSGQVLFNRKGFALYSSMSFMHAHMKKRQSFTNVKSSQQNVADKRTKLGSQFTGSNEEEQFQYAGPKNTQMSWTSNTAMQDRPYTLPQRVPNTPANTSWDHEPQRQTTNYLESIPMLPIHNTNTPVWIPSTATVPPLFPTVSHSLVTDSTPPVMINATAMTDDIPAQTSEAANVTESAITFATPAVFTESTIRSTAPTITESDVIPITSTSAVEPIVTSSSLTPVQVSAISELPITPSPPVRTHMPLTRMSSPNVRAPQCSPNIMSTPFSFYNPVSPSMSTSSSPAPPSPADSLYSSAYSDVSCDFNVEDVDTVQTRNPTAQRYTAMKSAFSTVTSPSVTLSKKNNSPVTPKGCYTKDSLRSKKLDPLEACMISLSNSIKDKLKAEPASKQPIKTPDQSFGDMVAMELSRMDEGNRAAMKALITDILFARKQTEVITSP